jgi:hypothetical protein
MNISVQKHEARGETDAVSTRREGALPVATWHVVAFSTGPCGQGTIWTRLASTFPLSQCSQCHFSFPPRDPYRLRRYETTSKKIPILKAYSTMFFFALSTIQRPLYDDYDQASRQRRRNVLIDPTQRPRAESSFFSHTQAQRCISTKHGHKGPNPWSNLAK